MPDFDNQRGCVQGKENPNSILIGYSASSELVLSKHVTIYSVRGTMALRCHLWRRGEQRCAKALNEGGEQSSRARKLRWPALGSFLLLSRASQGWFEGDELNLRELEHVRLGPSHFWTLRCAGLNSSHCWACSDYGMSRDRNLGSEAERKISMSPFFADFSVRDAVYHTSWTKSSCKPTGR